MEWMLFDGIQHDGKNMFDQPSASRLTSLCCLAALVLTLLQGCATVSPVAPKLPSAAITKLPAGFFLPPGIFNGLGAQANAGLARKEPLFSAPMVLPIGLPTALDAQVSVYASPSTAAYFASGGLDAKANVRTWEDFLKKYKIPYRVVTSVEQLEKLQPSVLLMPSAVALSEREKLAVIGFRAKGGSLLASWLTGVRNEKGEWRGFDFMHQALDAKVVGTTELEKNDTFLIPHGDNPVSHSLPSGLRVWMERVIDWYPLRLVGQHTAANIMDWGRKVEIEKPSGTVVFDERRQSSGRLSRSVVLGYPERLWTSADPKALEAIAHNALMWLLRQPDAFVSAWPQPYASATVMAVGAAETVEEADLRFAKTYEKSGGRATYYLTGEKAAKSASVLKQIQARGHEVAYYGDRFEAYKGQSHDNQSKRMDSMLLAVKNAGFGLRANAGFYAPLESYDETTEQLLKERAFGHLLAYKGASESRLPFFVASETIVSQDSAMVILPRTQNSPEYLTEEDPENGLANFLGEIELSHQMGALSVITFPNQNLLTKEQMAEILEYLGSRKDRMWLVTAGQAAQWWRERETVRSYLEVDAGTPVLRVLITGKTPLKSAVSVWVNLPSPGSMLRLLAQGSASTLKVTRVDAWRAAVALEGLPPGEYRWNVYFDSPATQPTP